jgi:hypothetical protein
MPPLSSLALRYVLWFVGLSILYGLLVGFAVSCRRASPPA